jgi:hypothetical protein
MRPPCRSCSAWATNSMSRMPPAPDLDVEVPPVVPRCSILLFHRSDRGDAAVVHRER